MASSWNKGTLAKTTDVMSSAITGDLGFGAVQSAIKSASRAVQDSNSLYSITETASSALSNAIKMAQDRMAQGTNAVSDVVSDVAPMVTQGVEAVSDVASKVDPLGAITSGVQTAGQAVMDTAQDMGGQALEFAQDVGSMVADTGSDLASDAVKGIKRLSKVAYDALPTKEKIIEDLKFTSQAITEGAKNAPSDVASAAVTLSNYAKAFTSPVAQNFINDLIHVSLYKGERFDPYTGEFYTVDLKEVEQEPITEDYFTPTTIDFLKKMARDKGLKGPNQKVSFEKEEVYKYLTKEGSGVNVSQTKGGASKEDIIKSLAERNPADEVKLILGSFSISTDENGEIKITDMFDYNEWYHPVTKKKYTADEFEEAFNAGELGTMDELIYKTIKTHGLGYSAARSIGFLLGSRGYENEDLIKQFSTGRKSNISLGNVSDLYTYAPETSLRPKTRPEQ